MIAAIERESRRRDLTYTRDDGKTGLIPLVAAPLVLTRADVRRLHRACLVMLGAFAKVAAARPHDPEVRALLPLTPEEEPWLAQARPGAAPLVARWDMNVAGGRAAEAQLFEMNGCAVGGLHYAQTASAIVHDLVAPGLEEPAGMGDLWMGLLRRATRRAGPRVVWLEDRDWDVGITEGPSLAARNPRIRVGDPRDLSFARGGGLRCAGAPVDVVYRSIELADLIAIEREERRPLAALREAVRRGRVVSPMEGDLDHKSLLEIFSSPRFARLFSAAERAVLRRHVPWTRLVTARTDDGVDLPEHVRRRRRALVLKPNRSCGGEGILIGRDTDAATWEAAIARSVSGREPHVAQAFVDAATVRAGRRRWWTTYGFLATPDGLGALGRAAPFRVVNVARGGGLAGVLVARRLPSGSGT